MPALGGANWIKVVTGLIQGLLAAFFVSVADLAARKRRFLRLSAVPGPVHTARTPTTGRKKPATGFRPWLVFNCVLLQQSVKLD
ncbi:hypothetical protein [Paraburkholderia terricola]|uniref:hypothetical protein n=1 Tax=Paraburkholderia terricola TaxID=169427 RepID=UPI000DEFFF08|nr:hypothetical protein [Paraburkholderia terricola]AXE94833.1 hypothetical protein CUJ90_20930 [Paraburkholderia terricola]